MTKTELKEALATAERRLVAARKNEEYWFKRAKRSNAERASLDEYLTTVVAQFDRTKAELDRTKGALERVSKERDRYYHELERLRKNALEVRDR